MSLLGNSTGTARLMNFEPVTVVGSPLRSLRISLANFFGFGVVGFRSAHSWRNVASAVALAAAFLSGMAFSCSSRSICASFGAR